MCFKYLSNNVWRDFSNGDIKFQFEKYFCSVNLPSKFSNATVSNTDLNLMLASFEPNHMVQNVQSFELFDKKKSNS